MIRLLQKKGAEVSYHDAHCPVIRDDGHVGLRGLPMVSVGLTGDVLRQADVVVIVTDHSAVDYRRVARLARVVVDTRGVLAGANPDENVIGLSDAPRSLTVPIRIAG